MDNPGGGRMGQPLLFLTRPEPQSRRIAHDVLDRFGDIQIVISPLMQTILVDGKVPVGTGVIFTSETAVAAFCNVSAERGLTAWCVGPRTAEAAAQAGFPTRTGPGNASELLQMIRAQNPNGPLIWPRGEHVAFDIGNGLNSAGIETVSVILYRQDAIPLTDEAINILQGDNPVLLPVFSPRSAQLLMPWLQDRTAPLFVAAISQNAADAIRDAAPDRLRISEKPDAEGVLNALGKLITESSAP